MATPNVVSGGSCTIQASGYSDPELDTIDVRIDWNNDGDFGDPSEMGLTLPGAGGAPVYFTAPITYTYGGGTDTQDLSAPYPLNLTAAPISLDLTQDISDLDINFHNQAIFVISETTTGVEHLYRIECDGTFQNPVSGGGGANPLSTDFTDFITQGRPFSLMVDNYDNTGALLPDQADVQIIVLGFSGTNTNDLHLFTSQLARTGGANFGIGTYLGSLDVQRNWIVARAGSAVANHRVYPNPPAGWQ